MLLELAAQHEPQAQQPHLRGLQALDRLLLGQSRGEVDIETSHPLSLPPARPSRLRIARGSCHARKVTATDAAQAAPTRRSLRALRFGATLTAVLALLFGVPYWTLFLAGAHWPTAVVVTGTVVFVAGFLALPTFMITGHGRRRRDSAAIAGDTLLGVIWVLFAWAVLGNVLRLALAIGGVADPARSRIVAVAVAAVSVVLLLWGYVEAMRVPRVKRVDVALPRLGAGLDGTRVALITDTHYGPIDRARWSAGVVAAVNALDADIVCHTGDIADGTVAERRAQAAPLGEVRARLARTYVTGNHEYFGEAQGWLDHMRDLGWEPLHNRHVVVTRDGASLVVAGVDDRTAAHPASPATPPTTRPRSPAPTRSCRCCCSPTSPSRSTAPWRTASTCRSPGTPTAGRSGRSTTSCAPTSPRCSGLSRHGARTQLYTSRGTGFWGPPFRVFAPSEITLLTLRAG